MNAIYFLTDYLNRFGSNYFDSPYRNGMDKDLLITALLTKCVILKFNILFSLK